MRKIFTAFVAFAEVLAITAMSGAAEKAYVNCDVLNVRVSPNTNCEIVTKLQYGTTLDIIYTDNGWYNVKLPDGVTGFVSAPYLTAYSEASSSEAGNNIAASVRNYVGYSYVYGAAGPSAFDCSGLTSYIYKQHGYSIPRTASSQATIGTPIEKGNLAAGDLVFFSNRSDRRINHVGIYVGDGNFIHASTSTRGVVKDSLYSNYYVNHYVTARRIV